jgi:hypothetical protein
MSARNPSIQTEGDLITLDRKTATSASPIGYIGRDQSPQGMAAVVLSGFVRASCHL